MEPQIKHLSYSSISTYLLCARSWKFRYLDKIKTPVAAALPFGSAFHETIKAYTDTKAVGGQPDPLDEIFNRAWNWRVENENIDYGSETPESIRMVGHRMLTERSVCTTIDGITPQMVNDQPVSERRVEFTVDGVPVPVVGFIDMIDIDGVPCDFKTASRSWYDSKADDELQPAFYLEALKQLGEMPSGGRFRYFIFTKAKKPKTQIIETSRTDKQLNWALDTIRDTWHGINSQVFPPNGIGGWKCSKKYCEYWDVCKG